MSLPSHRYIDKYKYDISLSTLQYTESYTELGVNYDKKLYKTPNARLFIVIEKDCSPDPACIVQFYTSDDDTIIDWLWLEGQDTLITTLFTITAA